MNKNPNDMTLAELEALYVLDFPGYPQQNLEEFFRAGWTAQQLINSGHLIRRAINVSDVQTVTMAHSEQSGRIHGNRPTAVIVDEASLPYKRNLNAEFGKLSSAATESSHLYPIHTTESTKAAMREVESWVADSRSINLTDEEVVHLKAGRSIDIGGRTITAATPPEGFSQDDSTLIPVTVTPHGMETWTADEMAQLVEATYPWDSAKLRSLCEAFGFDKYAAMIDTIANTDAECARNVTQAIASKDEGLRASILPRADLAAVKPTWLPAEMDSLKEAIAEGDAEWLGKLYSTFEYCKFHAMVLTLSQGEVATVKVLMRSAFGSSVKRPDRYSITASVVIGVVCVVAICVLVLRSWGVL